MTEPTKTQSAKFKAVARALGCDEDEATFEAKLKKIAKPTDRKAKKKKSNGRRK